MTKDVDAGLLQRVDSPADLRAVPAEDIPALAAEIRDFLVQQVARTGGHLGPNLGAVELTIALHRVFDSPTDAILWDTGHQTYVHKIITGRRDQFDHLRQQGGLSGYPSRAESAHDWVENSHASTALSYADGLAKAWQVTGGLEDRRVVAVVGDGSLTGGMAWEALNNIAASDRPMIIVVNDNERSYSPTIGGLANHLATLRSTGGYERFLELGRQTLSQTPVVGKPIYGVLHGVKAGLKDVMAPQGLFEDLGLKYLGPFDGHDVEVLERALHGARDFPGPVIVHAITQKGRGYPPAEDDDADKFHGVGVINPVTGVPTSDPGRTWTSVFSESLVAAGRRRADVVAITAAMTGPTGLAPFAEEFPDRFYDVGIAEQHAVTSAAGLAMGGIHPVVAVYATFLNRAYDQVLMDVALHELPVTIVLDRAGVTGDDGASHNGMWDLSMLATVPGIRVAAPRDEATLQTEFGEALEHETGPTVVRIPKGKVPDQIRALRRIGGVDVVAELGTDVLVVAIGSMVAVAVEAAEVLHNRGILATVVDPRWVLPIPTELVDLSKGFNRVVTVEDGLTSGGVGEAIRATVDSADVLVLGIPRKFLAHASRNQILEELGLTCSGLVDAVENWQPGHP